MCVYVQHTDYVYSEIAQAWEEGRIKFSRKMEKTS